MKRWVRMFAIAVTASLFYAAGPADVTAKEKEFPEKAIQFYVGFVPGSATDLAARALAKIAPKYLDKPLVVTNMPGAGQTVAMNELFKSTPDGHAIGLVTTAFNSLAVHQMKIPFDHKALIPLMGFGEFRGVMFVKGDTPYAKVDDLISHARKNPGWMKFCHSGRGTSIHIMGVLFFRSAKVDFNDVPFKGGAECVTNVIGGHVPAGITEVSGITQHLAAGTLKLSVTFTAERLKEYPDVPTSQEKGYADISSQNPLVYLAIHKDTPPERLKKLHDALKKTAEDPEFAELIKAMGMPGGYISPQRVRDTISNAESMGIPLMKELGMLVNQ